MTETAVAAAPSARGLEPLRVDPSLLAPQTVMPRTLARSAPPPAAIGTAPAAPVAPIQASGGPAPRIAGTQEAQPAGATPSGTLAAKSAAATGTTDGSATVVIAQHMKGQIDDVSDFDGNVELHRQATTLTSDHLTYDQVNDEVHATGDVVLKRGGDTVSGPELRLRMDTNQGFMAPAQYSFEREPRPHQARGANSGQGTADRIEFQGENQYQMKNATFSTCKPDNYAWYAKAGDIHLDYDQEVGVADDAKVVFKGLPILYLPTLDFPLNDRRKSGLLPMTFGSSNRTGVDVYVPWYWNIAPNMDATIAPRIMTRRGVQLNGEFRYLEPDYNGIAQVEWLPRDQVTGEARSAYQLLHNQRFASNLTGQLNLNHASDDNYYTDLGTRLTNTSQTYLLNQGLLSYTPYPGISTSLLVQKYQALQGLQEPYARLPSLSLTARRPDAFGMLDMSLNGSYTVFSHPSLVEANRLVLYPQVSLPLVTASGFLTPKLGLHSTRYQLTRQAAGVPDSISRNVPIVSVDSGLVFERDVNLGGNDWQQTLEPRLFYVYAPVRDQNQIPLFDTALADFNFAQIFSENTFIGSDRIADANQLTAAVTSRLIDPQNGNEIVRAAFGTRFYFKNQTVTLLPTDTPRTRTVSDYLAAVSGQVWKRTFVDSAVQYDSDTNNLQRFKFGVRYNPEYLKLVNVAYNFQRDTLREVDFSGQWPLARQWYGVGRYNYSLRDSRVIEALGGLEYDGGCWALRFVVQRLATGTTVANSSTSQPSFNTSFFIQLELNGLARLGANPLDLLRRSVPGYGIVNQPADDPVFGSTY